jgi:hypothetical protein
MIKIVKLSSQRALDQAQIKKIIDTAACIYFKTKSNMERKAGRYAIVDQERSFTRIN